MLLQELDVPDDHPSRQFPQDRMQLLLKSMDEQFATTGAYLAGSNLTAADIMTVFSLSKMRYYYLYSLA
jgi:glutathione S-transferase